MIPCVTDECRIRKAEKVLTAGRLAHLPDSAVDVHVWGWHSMFTGEDFLMFKASPEDINDFVMNSKSLNGLEVEDINDLHMYLPRSQHPLSADVDIDEYYKHKYYIDLERPDWWKPTIKIKGRVYEIPPDNDMRGHNSGSLIINDETNTVYIWVMWS